MTAKLTFNIQNLENIGIYAHRRTEQSTENMGICISHEITQYLVSILIRLLLEKYITWD